MSFQASEIHSALLFLNQAQAWFLKIDPVRIISVCVCVSVSVSVCLSVSVCVCDDL